MAGLKDRLKRNSDALGGKSTDPSAPDAAPNLLAGELPQRLTPYSLRNSLETPIPELPLDQIEPDPEQPRTDLGDLNDLAASIRENGVLQPIIVTVAGVERYRILAGERRFHAARLAGLTRVPALVRTVEEQNRLQLQMVENLHRKDLGPFEEARGYRALMDQFNLTQEEIARRLGGSQESVSETLRLLTLPADLQADWEAAGREGKPRLARSVLLEIARRPRDEQDALWARAREGGLTVRAARAARRAAESPDTAPPSDTLRRRVLPVPGGTVTVELAADSPTAPGQRARPLTRAALAAALRAALAEVSGGH